MFSGCLSVHISIHLLLLLSIWASDKAVRPVKILIQQSPKVILWAPLAGKPASGLKPQINFNSG